ncbi:MAG: arginine--tRNA ligase [bacterium]
MYSLERIKIELAEKINNILGNPVARPEDFVYPPNKEMGDLSLPCFNISKKLDLQPNEVARKIIDQALEELSGLAVMRMAGPYVNFDLPLLTEELLHEIDEHYGEDQADGKIMIEYSNVNTHKEYHIGHLRNIIYGDAVSRILSVNGYDVIPVSYVNDFGIHTAKTVWHYLTIKKDPEEEKGHALGKLYVEAVQRLENNDRAKKEMAVVMQKIENHEGKEYRAWKKTRDWSIDYFNSIYNKLNIKFDKVYYESEYIKKGIKIVNDLYKKEILIQSNGAILADLENYNLSVLVFLRSDGTALYPVADLALAVAKFKKGIDQSIYIVDNRQTLYFKQLFKVLELMGYKQKMIHLPYDFVKLPSGMMSSRTGNTISFNELYDQVLEKIKNETKTRHQDWTEQHIQKVAEIIAISVLKFEMIKVSANRIINFNIDDALRFDGFTAVYLQYTCARINSIIRKAKLDLSSADFTKLNHLKEKAIIMHLAKYPEIIKLAGATYQPAEIAKYLFELAKMLNDYYHDVQILKSEEQVKQARLELIMSVRQVIINGLGVLGIDIVDEM